MTSNASNTTSAPAMRLALSRPPPITAPSHPPACANVSSCRADEVVPGLDRRYRRLLISRARFPRRPLGARLRFPHDQGRAQYEQHDGQGESPYAKAIASLEMPRPPVPARRLARAQNAPITMGRRSQRSRVWRPRHWDSARRSARPSSYGLFLMSCLCPTIKLTVILCVGAIALG